MSEGAPISDEVPVVDGRAFIPIKWVIETPGLRQMIDRQANFWTMALQLQGYESPPLDAAE